MNAIPNRIRQRSVRLERHHHPQALHVPGAVKAPGLFTRRHFLAGVGAAAASGGALFAPKPVEADDEDSGRGPCRPGAPRPIPGEDPDLAGLGLHVFLPVPGREPSTIFDFHGGVAILDLIGDCKDESDNLLAFRADLRIMEGTYVGLDGKRHRNAFGFI